jgi:CHAD domain-containing protein
MGAVENHPVLAVNTQPVQEGEWIGQPTVATQAYLILSEQHQQLEKYQSKILKDPSPEPLHHFRVALRRLATAKQVFTGSLKLPKALSQKKVQRLRIQLGKQRDLDVLLTLLQDIYSRLPKGEQVWLDQILERLQQKRQKNHRKVYRILSSKAFGTLQTTYTKWIQRPRYTHTAHLPLAPYLPGLLLPILSEFLFHPAWMMTFDDLRAPLSQKQAQQLHDLRKLCKKVRYQAEFFAEWYGESFHLWLEELKTLQDCLGFLQDQQILRQWLEQLPKEANLPQFWSLLNQDQAEQLVLWLGARQKYQDLDFHQHLYILILHPKQSVEATLRKEAMGSQVSEECQGTEGQAIV